MIEGQGLLGNFLSFSHRGTRKDNCLGVSGLFYFYSFEFLFFFSTGMVGLRMI